MINGELIKRREGEEKTKENERRKHGSALIRVEASIETEGEKNERKSQKRKE